MFGQMKDRQGADRFSMRSLARRRGEWQLDPSTTCTNCGGVCPPREKSRNRRGEGQEDGLIRRPSRGRHTDLDSAMAPSWQEKKRSGEAISSHGAQAENIGLRQFGQHDASQSFSHAADADY